MQSCRRIEHRNDLIRRIAVCFNHPACLSESALYFLSTIEQRSLANVTCLCQEDAVDRKAINFIFVSQKRLHLSLELLQRPSRETDHLL